MPLRENVSAALIATALGATAIHAQGKSSVSDAFRENEDWEVAPSVTAYEHATGFSIEGSYEGPVVYNGEQWVDDSFLLSKNAFGDCEVKLEFMLPKGSESGVYLQGRYEVQLADSYGKIGLSFSDLGGLYQMRGENDEGDDMVGQPPLLNAAAAPGTWQTLEVKFRAPRFNGAGDKTEDALFVEVKVNGQVVQRNAEVSATTLRAPFEEEGRRGPIAIEGDRGPVAIRSFEVRHADLDSAGATRKSADDR